MSLLPASALSSETANRRRGACPALSAPMLTGDGLLSRVALTGSLQPSALAALCALSQRHGNGILDVTARGNIQFRGLSERSARQLATDVERLALPLRGGIAVENSPLAGIDEQETADPRTIIEAIRLGVVENGLDQRLAPKMAVAVDGAGQLPMADLLADIRLKAVMWEQEVFWQLHLGGTEAGSVVAGLLRTQDAAAATLLLLQHLAEKGNQARGRDLDLGVVENLCGGFLVDVKASISPGGKALPFGLLRLGEKAFVLRIAVAFGQVDAADMVMLCQRSERLGITAVSPALGHAMLFFGSESACLALLEEARNAGFIVTADDARSAIATCSGSPSCASAQLPTHDLASLAAHNGAALLDGSFDLHISGCGKGCAHPSPALLSFSGHAEGMAFGFLAKAGDAASAIIPAKDRDVVFSRLADLFRNEHKPGEDARACLVRLGPARISAALLQDNP